MNDKYDIYMVFDQPIPYKELRIHPVLMKDYAVFNYLSQALLVDKNSISDVDILSMTYLEYLYKYNTNEDPYIAMLQALFQIVTRNPELKMNMGIDENNKMAIIIGGVMYSSMDFDEIKNIVAEQNMLELPDDMMQKEVRDKLREAEEFKRRISGIKRATLEDLVICVMISTAMSVEDVGNLTIRKFGKILERVDNKLHYEIYLSAQMSGFVKFKDKSVIKHWMSDLRKDRYSDVKVQPETIKSEINLDNARKALQDKR